MAAFNSHEWQRCYLIQKQNFSPRKEAKSQLQYLNQANVVRLTGILSLVRGTEQELEGFFIKTIFRYFPLPNLSHTLIEDLYLPSKAQLGIRLA